MHVLLTTDAFPPICGGSGWSTFELARGLRAAGHRVSIVRPRPGEPAGVRLAEYEGFTVHEIGSYAPRVPYLRNYFKNERLARHLARWLRGFIREQAVDLVHAQHLLSTPGSIAAAKAARVPIVCTVRDYWPVCYWSDLIHDYHAPTLCPACSAGMMTRCVRPRAGALWPATLPLIPYMRRNLRWKRETLSRADAIIAVSSTIARDLHTRAPELARTGTRVEIIPNPVDMRALRDTASRDLTGTPAVSRSMPSESPIQGSSPTAFAPAEPLAAARKTPSASPTPAAAAAPFAQSHDSEAAAIAAMPRPYAIYIGKLAPNKGSGKLMAAVNRAALAWPLVIVGDGPDRAAVEAAARASGRDVRFTGWLARDEALRWLAQASLLIFPSHGPESLSRVLLEASALGVPAAAMDTGGTRDIITHEQTGLLSSSADELGDHIARLVADDALRARLGAAARAWVDARFDAHAVVSRIIALYDDLRHDTRGREESSSGNSDDRRDSAGTGTATSMGTGISGTGSGERDTSNSNSSDSDRPTAEATRAHA
jgi:glycosyltransferase involved in cell wall biosynthesis